MVNSKLKTLSSHLTIACILLACLWLLASDKHILIIGNSLILVYVVSILGFCVIPKKKEKHYKR
jgi:hypothetical protein